MLFIFLEGNRQYFFCFFQQLFSDETIRDWFVNCGRDLISSLLVKSDKVYIAYSFKCFRIYEVCPNVSTHPPIILETLFLKRHDNSAVFIILEDVQSLM